MRRAPTRTILKQPPMSYAELADPLFQHGSDPLRVKNVPVTRIGIGYGGRDGWRRKIDVEGLRANRIGVRDGEVRTNDQRLRSKDQ